MKILKLKGTKDILPEEIGKYKYVQNIFAKTLEDYGYGQIRFPVFEHTELFQRGVGDTTDIVQKEMYTFLDKGGRSITLRPEGTASVVRSFIENGMMSWTQPVKLYYDITAYRYENVQKGRYREFNQLGAEIIGSASAHADVEIINMLDVFFNKLGIRGLQLNLNSIGCKECRVEYNEKIREYFKQHISGMCIDCQHRFERNPLRLLDCKQEHCINISNDAPMLLDNLCEECSIHFDKVQSSLNEMNVPFIINKKLVRGLDYYEKTVFEFISDSIGAQDTVCAGGRYDGLVKLLGGADVSGIGFAMGLERLIDVMLEHGLFPDQDRNPTIMFAYVGQRAYKAARKMANELRSNGFYCEIDINERSLKAQLKFADRKNAKYVVVLGEEEIDTNKAIIKNMNTQESKEVSIETIVKRIIEDKV